MTSLSTGRRLRNELRLALLLLFMPVLLTVGVSAQQQLPTQHDVEAAYLLRFGSFLRQPPESIADPRRFTLCVLGKNPFAGRLHDLAEGERVNGRLVNVIMVENAATARMCSILFISESEANHLTEVLKTLRDSDALTVSDMPQFLEHGGMIQFILQTERVRFGINLDAVSETRLSLSSELIRVAASVIGTPKPERRP